ncbi:uncharacterized protein LOC135491607 [Lineus longissimus]|uniref:uncharacterized protein LOC135491607 n=1 Tax=Lineus longissimus TaxID=88925 RepID=UPI00315D6D8E
MAKHKVNKNNPKKKNTQNPDSRPKALAVLPYVKGVTETIERYMRKAGVATACRPHTTIRQLLVHPKDKRDMLDITDCIYQIPCANCDNAYIGETGRKFSVRLKEHQKDVGTVKDRKYTRANRLSSQSEFNKSAITDHVAQVNHNIDWDNSKVLEKESTRFTRWVKEAIWIRKTTNMNRDEGGYKLSHVWDASLAATSSGQTQD